MKKHVFKSYAAGADIASGIPAHLAPVVAVNARWVLENGSRAQRRRVKRALQRAAAKKSIAHTK